MTDSRFRLTDDQCQLLHREFGTPLYVLDEASFRQRIRRYRIALSAHWPKTEISFASKANSTLQLLKIAYEEGTTIDVASEGEFRAAMLAGVPPSACHMHGNNKQLPELELAHKHRIGQIMIDNHEELELLAKMADWPETDFVLRVAPGVNPETNAKISTGQADTKFGFGLGDGSAEAALLRARELGLSVKGIHCHVGSQLFDATAQSDAGTILAEFIVRMYRQHSLTLDYLNIGGGLAAKYLDEEEPTEIEPYCMQVITAIRAVLEPAALQPTIAMEPGRSLVAECGVTLYEVGVVKTSASGTVYVSVDGGLSDNPRPVMYGAKYAIKLVGSEPGWEYLTDGPGALSFGTPDRDKSDEVTVTISGRHCETDTLFKDVQLPRTPKKGDLIQVLTTGAYHSVMASNYNRFLRPATVLIRDNGEPALIQRRETYDELFAREILI